MKNFSHVDKDGKANMVDVGDKNPQNRTAIAEGYIYLQSDTINLIKSNEMKKGDVLTISEIAGIQAAKRTYELIPLCHTLMLTKVDVKCTLTNNGVYAKSKVRCIGQTGVEMEALTAVNIALLTIYDMCKAVDKTMTIGNIKLLDKQKENL